MGAIKIAHTCVLTARCPATLRSARFISLQILCTPTFTINIGSFSVFSHYINIYCETKRPLSHLTTYNLERPGILYTQYEIINLCQRLIVPAVGNIRRRSTSYLSYNWISFPSLPAVFWISMGIWNISTYSFLNQMAALVWLIVNYSARNME